MVDAIALEQDGTLWVGTDGGVARLDRQGHWQSSTGTTILALAHGQDGTLWAGSLGDGLGRLDHGRWQSYTRENTNGGLPNDNVAALALGQNGTLWAGTLGGGLARLDHGRWQSFTRANTSGALPDDKIRALALGQDGTLWVGTNRGLARLHHGRWQSYNRANTNGALPCNVIDALAVGPDGTLWVGTAGCGVARLDHRRWQSYSQANTSGGLSSDVIGALALGDDGLLWVGTNRGLALLDHGRWLSYNRATANGALPSDVIEGLAVGPDGTLWVGSGGGLARLDYGRWQSYTRANTSGGLPADGITTLVLGQDGTTWVGTVRGLAQLNHGRWQSYTRATTSLGLRNDAIEALAVGADNVLWAGTLGGGLARLDHGRWRSYTAENTKGGLPGNDVDKLALGLDGTLWVSWESEFVHKHGDDSGLARLDHGRWQNYTAENTKGGLPDHAEALALGQDGTLWVGTRRGVVRFKDGQWEHYTTANTDGGLPSDAIRTLALAPDGALWVGTDGGIARLEHGRWRKYTEENTSGGLPNGGSIAALAVGHDGTLWVGTWVDTYSLDLAHLNHGHWQNYTEENTSGGLPSGHIAALAPGLDGTLWVGTAESGVRRFKPPSSGTVKILNVVGETGDVSQADETVAVEAFDSSYLTQPQMLHYLWSLSEPGSQPCEAQQSSVLEASTTSPFIQVHFSHEGTFRLCVEAIDRYGSPSESKPIVYHFTSPKPPNLWDRVVLAWPVIVSVLTTLYAVAFVILLFLTKRHAWAFRLISDAVWAKWLTWPFFLLRNVHAVQRWVLGPWFMAQRQKTDSEIQSDVGFIEVPVSSGADLPCDSTKLFERLRHERRIWLHGRSGMGKSSVFAAWQRAYFAKPSLDEAVRKYGFIFVTISVRDYADLEPPETNRPESWVLEAVRRQLEGLGFATRDLSLIEALLRAGQIAVALDGMNEADRGLALTAFSRQFKTTPLLVTSQAMPGSDRSEKPDNQWKVGELPKSLDEMRLQLLSLWLGEPRGAILDQRISNEKLDAVIVSGYDLRLIADLAERNSERTRLPRNRAELYRMILAQLTGVDGEPLDLEGLKKLAWLMVTQRRRRIQPDDEILLGRGILQLLTEKQLPIIRTVNGEREFRHDQMRAFLAALWLIEEIPGLWALQRTTTESHAFDLNRRDQEDLWGFLAPLLESASDLQEIWRFANDDPVECAVLIAALQAEADRREISLTRLARQATLPLT